MLVFIISMLPIPLAILLGWLQIQMNTGEFLTLTLQVVWGIMVSLGGGVIYLTKFKFDSSNTKHAFRSQVSEKIKWLCFPLIIHTLLFIFLAIFYPLRNFITLKCSISSEIYLKIATFADAVLIGLIATPSIFSILIGLWCIYLAIYHGE